MSVPPAPNTWRAQVYAALQAYHNTTGTPTDLLASWLLTQEVRRYNSHYTQRQATNAVLEQGLQVLANISSKNLAHATLLRKRFIQEAITRALAQKGTSVDQINRQQKQAISALAEVLWELEQEALARQALTASLAAPTYTQLFGVAAAQALALAQLQSVGAPWLVVITGIGGIGKTALADAVARQVAQHLTFQRFHFVRLPAPLQPDRSPRQALTQTITALALSLNPTLPDGLADAEQWVAVQLALQAGPQLVLIDNLEAPEELAAVVEVLGSLTGPSKFLLTSRTRPALSSPAFCVALDELPEAEALALLRYEATRSGLTHLASATTAELSAIYAIVGGNPYALKLVVGQARVQPLGPILDALRQNQSGEVEKMYRHLYRLAWTTLSEAAQQTWLALLLAAEVGATWDNLLANSELPTPVLQATLEELHTRCLIEVRGSPMMPRYGLHRLTETFLRNEIWQAFL